ncbi:MAG: glycosyltransferase family protein [Mogibacterium sp.]|nr:glycosyltransferase family protein [Mogibacterium sp.]
MRTGCIIQARMTSSRLPGKVLRTIDYQEGKSVLGSVVERVRSAKKLDHFLIACTTNSDDDPLVEYAKREGIACFRGSENDVLDRFYGAANEFGYDNIVRITSDCPFLDPSVIDALIELFIKGNYQYASNCIRRTYPHGLDCEIFTYDVLKWMHKNTEEKFYREHVTSYVTSHQDEFRVGSLTLDGEDYSKVRITVDTVNDYTLACIITDLIRNEKDRFSFRTVLDCFAGHPYISAINADIMQKKKYDTLEEELEAAEKLLKLQEMDRAAELLRRNH